MKKPLYSAGFPCLLLLLSAGLSQTVWAQATGHKLYGDLRVDEKSLAGLQSATFLVSLVAISGGGMYGPGNVIDRQQVAPNGRFQFLGVPNGEYDLVIERENIEVARTRFMIQERRYTDIRRDVSLQWRTDTPGTARAGLDSYKRSPAASSRFEKALQASKNEDYGKASDILKQVVSADPKDFEAWTELGTVQFKQGQLPEAEKSYQRALDEKPDYFPALLNLGKLRFSQKSFDAAIEILTRAAKAQPESADVQYYLGESYLQVKKGSLAVGFLKEAIRLDPLGKADVHLRLAALFNAAGMKDKASEEYAQFLEKKPSFPDKAKLEEYIRQNKKS